MLERARRQLIRLLGADGSSNSSDVETSELEQCRSELRELRSKIDAAGVAPFLSHQEPPDLGAVNHELHVLKERLERLGLASIVHGDLTEDVSRFLSWRPPGHFYSPVPDLSVIDPEKLGVAADGGPGLDLRVDAQRAWFDTLAPFLAEWPFPDTETDGFRYFAPNSHFDGGDGGILYATLRALEPKRIVEIGSGFSTGLILDTIERFLSPSTEFTAIEPFPVVLGTRLRDTDAGGPLQLIEAPVQDVDLDVFRRLGPGDICFIDSTHVVKLGSDVSHLFRHVVPELPAGVLLHIHDMFWPFEYPLPWTEEGRAWNELQLVEAFLRFNDRFQIRFFNDWFGKTQLPEIAGQAADHLRHHGSGGSLWIEIVD